MALGNVRRVFPALVAIGLLQGCFTTGDDDDDSSSSGCSKDADCKNGRICENKKCVDDTGGVLGGSSGTANGQGGSSTPANGGTGNAAKGGSSGTQGGSGGSGATGGSTPANGGSASGSGGASGSSSGTGGSSAGTSGTCSPDDPATCPTADSMTFCANGSLVTYTCQSYCDTLGFPTGPCAPPDGCACDFENPTDETCVVATNALCGCVEGTANPCIDMVDPNDPDSVIWYPPFIYASCHGGSQEDMDFLHCLADQAQMSTPPTCQDGFAACGVDTGSAGASGM